MERRSQILDSRASQITPRRAVSSEGGTNKSRIFLEHSSTAVDFRASGFREKSGVPPVLESRISQLDLVRRTKKTKKKHTRARMKVFELLSEVEDENDRMAKIDKLRSSLSAIDAQFKRMGKPTISVMPIIMQSDETVDKPVMLTTIRFEAENEALRFFQRTVRIVVITLRWINYILKINENKRTLNHELKSFTDIAFEFDEGDSDGPLGDSGLTFDKSYFKSKKEITICTDIRRTLTIRSDARSKEMLKHVMHGLQTLESLAEYPLHIQAKLCRVAWYQQIEPKKVIIRQGHLAESFYFILSGKAFVKQMARLPSGETELRTLARLGRGQSFGELALLYRTARTATVESATYMELLVVGRDDFVRIFTNGECPDREPDHVKFLRDVPVIRDWPIDKIANEPGSCILHYFKRGAVVTVNNEESEWIYIVKAGYCDVLKRLNSVKARSALELSRQRPRAVERVTPQTCGPVTSARINNGKTRQKCYSVNPDVYDVMTDYFRINQVTRHPDLGRHRLHRTSASTPPVAEQVTKPLDLKNHTSMRRQSVRVVVENYSDLLDEPTECPKPPLLPLLQFKHWGNAAGEGMGSRGSTLLPRINEKKHDVSFKPKKSDTESNISDENRRDSVFVNMEVLRPRDVFGVNTLQIGECPKENTPVCLVSRGAELVLLSKRLFLKHVDDNLKHTIQTTAMDYPKERAMQQNLQQEVDWKLYKETLVGDYVTNNVHYRSLTIA